MQAMRPMRPTLFKSTSIEAARAGAVQEVVREVAQAAMEHHQATIESLDDELGKPGEEKYLKERLGCAWGIFFFYNFPSFLSKGTKMHK